VRTSRAATLRDCRQHGETLRVAVPESAVVRSLSRDVVARAALGVLALGAAVGAYVIAEGPGRSTTYAGTSTAAAVLWFCAGLGLIATGLLLTDRRSSGASAELALAAGLTWFAAAWVAWQEGPPLVRSSATVLAAFTFPLLVQLVLSYPAGRLQSLPARAVVAALYVQAGVVAALLALFREPYLDRACWANCSVNSFLVVSRPGVTRAVELADRWLLAIAAVAVAAICAARLRRASRVARRRLAPVDLAACGLAVAMVARAVALQHSPVEDPFRSTLRAIFAGTAVSVLLLATGLVRALARSRAERRAVSRVLASLDEAPAPGFLQAALAGALGDAELTIAYPLGPDARYIDAQGQAVAEPAPGAGRTLTRLTREGRPVAVVSHADASDLGTYVGPSILLGLENERLQAEVLARLDELRASRTRIVETADRERRRLEHDLHDGAQQGLLALSYDLRLACAAADADEDTETAFVLSHAVAQTQAALEELRELAHGIFPAVLTEAGLAAALATFADTAPVPVQLGEIESVRHPSVVDATAFFAVTEAVHDAARRNATFAAVSVREDHRRLLVDVEDDGVERSSTLAGLVDRVGALSGNVAIGPRSLRAEIPCG
jgi:signal transduction histidine kinase